MKGKIKNEQADKPSQAWHAIGHEKIVDILKTSKQGLSEEEAKQRLQKYGYNELKEKKRRTALQMFLDEFKDIFIMLLIAATIFSIIIGYYESLSDPSKGIEPYTDSITIGVIVLLCAITGFVQEYRAEKAMEALKKLTALKARVIRNGKEITIPAKEVVPGDILVLESGDHVPADAHIIEAVELKADEAVLTGESIPVKKELTVLKPETPLAERKNMLFTATHIVYGRGKAVVVATGMNTEFGKIAEMVQTTEEEETPLQKKLDKFAKKIAKVVVAVCAIIFALEAFEVLTQGWKTEGFIQAFMSSISLAISAVPEGLPAIVTISLALGARGFAKRNAIVRRLSSAESLGSVTVICVPGDTPIICNSSLKTIDSVKVGDKVLGVDGDFYEVLRTYKRNYSGTVVRIKPMGLPWLTITPEHPVLVAKIKKSRPVISLSRPRKIKILGNCWIRAGDVKKGDMVLIPRIKDEKSYSFSFRRGRKRNGVKMELDEELAELFGWYLAEGCTSIQKGSYRIIFYLGKNEPENVRRIRWLIEKKLGLKTYIYETRTSLSIIALNQDLTHFLRDSFGENAKNKKIPKFILNSPKSVVRKFLCGYLKGDGNIDDYYIRFATTSKTLAYQLIILLAKLGIRARLHIRKGGSGVIEGRIVNISESYEIFISGTQADVISSVKYPINEKKKNLFLFDENFVYVPIRDVRIENASLDVFNIETSSQTYSLPFVVHNCSDKTGTLTKGEMTVRKVYVGGKFLEISGVGYEPKGEFRQDNNVIGPKEDLLLLLRIGALCNNSHLEKNDEKNIWEIRGDPTEGALVVSAAKAGLEKGELEKLYSRIAEIPFASERKCMTTVHAIEDKIVAYMKGAPEIILEKCSHILENDKEEELSEAKRKRILEINERLAGEALRVLAMAYRKLPSKIKEYDEKTVEKEMVFVGLQGMIDPPREEAIVANKTCQKAGIKAVMITGDHKLTAIAVAKEIGIWKEGDSVLTGVELDKLGDEEFTKMVESVTVYARVSPQHKLKIIKALKAKGHIVAMTGDGVNDAPAVKSADIGVAMGISGTDVTREASDIILADDNFATIVKAVEQGRAIYNNIRKYARFLISCNFDELLVIGAFALLGGIFGEKMFPLPLLPAMILWINLVTDGAPAVALATDPPDEGIMEVPPRKPKEGILHGMGAFIIASFLLQATGTILVFSLEYYIWPAHGFGTEATLNEARTVAFVQAALFELFVVWNCRSEKRSVWRMGRDALKNKFFVIAAIVSVILTVGITYIPITQQMFHLVALSPADLAYVLGVASLGFFIFPEIFMGRKVWHWE